ncbi:uncharacterized protein EV422DRAFT_212865 [Fimicolochytrium jonesii]|uniref:uncharacterized protein n=1 Tax=Fimicolochytrium jonesii TaxID=1396493 RepID=UPI0022FF12EF|nr:uncharacterized protein EV422DRAFT_212865 [Fimicolochytrium jonesii]KAI8817704.1 hypothetical protein EV422DRAFT_212865 [Fimicolochytrium jonesii]
MFFGKISRQSLFRAAIWTGSMALVCAVQLSREADRGTSLEATRFAAADINGGVYYEIAEDIKGKDYAYTVYSKLTATDSNNVTKWESHYTEEASSYTTQLITGEANSDVYEVGIAPDFIATRRFDATDGTLLYTHHVKGSACPSPVYATGAADPLTGDFYLLGVCQPTSETASDDDGNFLFVQIIDKKGKFGKRRRVKNVQAAQSFISIGGFDGKGEAATKSGSKTQVVIYVAGYRNHKGRKAGVPFVAAYKPRTLAQISPPRKIDEPASYPFISSLAVPIATREPIVALSSPSDGDGLLLRSKASLKSVVANVTIPFADAKILAGKTALYVCGTPHQSQGPVELQVRHVETLELWTSVKLDGSTYCEFLQLAEGDGASCGDEGDYITVSARYKGSEERLTTYYCEG